MTAMSKKRSPGFSGKNRGVTTTVAAPGVTHSIDATVARIFAASPHFILTSNPDDLYLVVSVLTI